MIAKVYLGDGDLTKKHLNILTINSNKVKVLEAWQGHLNDAKIFKGEINKIQEFKNKKILRTGINGQDGAYLAKLLLTKNHKVGILRNIQTINYKD